MAKMVRRINEELALYETARANSIKKLAKLNDDGTPKADDRGMIQFKDENGEADFIADMGFLDDIDVEIGTIPLVELGDIEMTTQQMMVLGELITE